MVYEGKIDYDDDVCIIRGQDHDIILDYVLDRDLVLLQNVLRNDRHSNNGAISITNESCNRTNRAVAGRKRRLDACLIGFDDRILRLLIYGRITFRFFFRDHGLLICSIREDRLISLILRFFLRDFRIIVEGAAFYQANLIRDFLDLILDFINDYFDVISDYLRDQGFYDRLFG